jgi:hypothetical protein
LDPKAAEDRETMLIIPEKSHSNYDTASRVSRTNASQATCSEVGEAFRKVIIKKAFKNDHSEQLINLN